MMVEIKGAPVTFDLEKLKEKLSEVASGNICGWPVYNRLLLDMDGWRDLSDMADYTISIKADPDMLKERLVERKISTGSPRDKAISFVEFSDMANVMLCLEKTKPADLELILSKESGYSKL